ncbi:hypothetical protein LZD49_12470 [Dyadobacter sp. CY261]|uniref:hypothetical protein n=1 Tax=Dyadobacter sp. CY261 TaxID=2907203 RepID=UPI001F19EF51|nr:hypothetical protein [Dyadobacter sp. CY261]MCF0071287.1 hypothetical protein [Dyadobacter sp. CY261]
MDAEFYPSEPVLSAAALDEVEQSAYAQLSLSDISILVEVDEFHVRRWMDDRHHPFFIRVNRGRLRFQREMNESLILLAKTGESSALISIEKAMERQRILDA